MKQNKIWPVLRDVIIVTVLSGLGEFIVGFASTDHNTPLYIYSLAISNSLFITIGFTISGCLAVGNRWRHLAFVGAIVSVVSIFNVVFFGLTFIQWAASVVAIAIFAVIGGGISLLFKRKTLVEISSNSKDEKFYEEVARELREKPMVPGLWTKAFAETGGDDAKARALYIKYRVAQLEAGSRQQRPEEQKHFKYTQVIFAAVIFVAVVLAVVFGVMTSNKNIKANSSAVTSTEQLPAVQTPAESEFDRQKKLAEKGDVNAQEYLGLGYSIAAGQEVLGTNANSANQDYAKAIEWYRMAAEQGSAQGQFFLGYCYSGGKGVAQDFAEAIKWLRKSADQGHGEAQLYLGECYAQGQGVETNLVEAAKWISLAVTQNIFFAERSLSLAEIESQMTPEQIAEAQRLSREFRPTKFIANQNDYYLLFEDTKAKAENGDMIAQYNLGIFYWKGQGVTSDWAETIKWIRMSSEQGYPAAQVFLADRLSRGYGVIIKRDEAEAAKWYLRAAKQNVADAQSSIGYCYYSGTGVPKNYVEAYKWNELSHAQGHVSLGDSLFPDITSDQKAEGIRLAREFKPQMESVSNNTK